MDKMNEFCKVIIIRSIHHYFSPTSFSSLFLFSFSSLMRSLDVISISGAVVIDQNVE